MLANRLKSRPSFVERKSLSEKHSWRRPFIFEKVCHRSSIDWSSRRDDAMSQSYFMFFLKEKSLRKDSRARQSSFYMSIFSINTLHRSSIDVFVATTRCHVAVVLHALAARKICEKLSWTRSLSLYMSVFLIETLHRSSNDVFVATIWCHIAVVLDVFVGRKVC